MLPVSLVVLLAPSPPDCLGGGSKWRQIAQLLALSPSYHDKGMGQPTHAVQTDAQTYTLLLW